MLLTKVLLRFLIFTTFCFLIVLPCYSQTYNFLDAGEISAITAISLGTGYFGHKISLVDSSKESLIGQPPSIDVTITRWLGGECKVGKQNFLDDSFGSIITPIISMSIITASDLSWPQGDKEKFVTQDLFLFGTGLIFTKGVTDFTKGIVARQRPINFLEPEISSDRKNPNYSHDHNSFFSGHTTSAFYSMTYLNKRIRSIMRHELTTDEYKDVRWISSLTTIGWASFVGLSRIEAYRHYFTDVAAGAIAGWLISELFYSFNDNEFLNSEAGQLANLTNIFRISIPIN